MPLIIDKVETEIEVFRAEDTFSGSTSGGADTLAALRGQNRVLDKLRPLVLDIIRDELKRIARKVGPP